MAFASNHASDAFQMTNAFSLSFNEKKGVGEDNRRTV